MVAATLVVFGLSLILAAGSLWYYYRQVDGPTGPRRRGRDLRIASDLGMMCCCLGLAGGTGVLWQRGLWAALSAGFLVSILFTLRPPEAGKGS
mgnify:CR=1 FL=1